MCKGQDQTNQSRKQIISKLQEDTLRELVSRPYPELDGQWVEKRLEQLGLLWLLTKRLQLSIIVADIVDAAAYDHTVDKGTMLELAGHAMEHYLVDQGYQGAVLFRIRTDGWICIFAQDKVAVNAASLMAELRDYVRKYARIHTIFETAAMATRISSLHESCRQVEESLMRSRINAQNQIVSEVERYILGNYSENLTLQTLAAQVHVSPSWLSKLIKKETGKNFLEHLTDTRLDVARSLLNDLNLKIYHVSSRVGYQDTIHFSRLFKRKYGLTPQKFRNNRMINSP